MPDPGSVIAIGGHEDRSGDRGILKLVAGQLAGRPLALVTAASRHPEGYVPRYVDAFAELGVTVEPVPLDGEAAAAVLERAGGVFLTGGKQLRLVSRLREFGIAEVLRRLHESGGVVAGTSAGASALADLMILRGPARRAAAGSELKLGSGLGLIAGVVIDQHFTERGRSARLRAAVATRPDHLGIGIDEDTAIEVVGDSLVVHGSGTVTVIDARMAGTTAAVDDRPATVHDAVLHVLAAGDSFAL